MTNSTLGKRKRFLPSQQEQLRRTIAEQFDLEIALKRRLLAAAQARSEWARILKDAITEKNGRSPPLGYPPTAFRDAALATYESIEDLCEIIVSESDRPSRHRIDSKTMVRPGIRASSAPRTRKRATIDSGQGLAAGPLLFEDNSTTTPVTLKLVCSDCSRSDFPTMQGFLNHCRLAHLRTYGSHDECIQTCGTIIENEEREALVAAGVEIKTVYLLSLKRIFERAVGLGQNMGPSLDDREDQLVEGAPSSTHLSQTLGFHKDTPTLAPFLGKEVKKKVIHVYDDPHDIAIDIVDIEPSLKPHTPWISRHRKKYKPGNEISINAAAIIAQKTGEIEGPQHVLNVPSDQGSRFHITRRILVSDKSLYLPPNKRASNTDTMSHTHRWQISVSSPSYEQHISTFLSHLTVVCATEPPVFASQITVSQPPFIACSTTDRPFLARLILRWVGEQNNEFVVEHWVELDQFKAMRPVLGEEQILDVELDRKTVFRPVSISASTIPWTGESDQANKHRSPGPANSTKSGNENSASESEPPYIRHLREVTSRFPMTMQDIGGRQGLRVPYTIHASPAKLLGLVMGRRKAIEWSRALAIQSEYDSLHGTSSSSEDHVSLTAAEVYRWLENEGLFPRPRRKIQKPPVQIESSPSSNNQIQEVNTNPLFCSVCGVDVRFHVPGIPFKSKQQTEGEPTAYHCPPKFGRHRKPILHVSMLVAPLRIPYWAPRSDLTTYNITQSTARDFVSVGHPHITQLVRQEVSSLHLSRLGAAPTGDGDEMRSGKSRGDLEELLAPYSVLGVVMEKVIRDMVRSALQVARDRQAQTKTVLGRNRGATLTSLLTPTHVLQGLINGAEMGGSKEALLKCLARVGTVLESTKEATKPVS